MKKKVIVSILFACIFVLGGCGKSIYPDLPDNPTAFEMGSLIYGDDEAGYGTIEYNGRTYVPYGTLGKTLHRKDIKECIGYIICDENSSSYTDLNDTDTRVYTLTDDEENNFLMDYYSKGVMEQPHFWRAADTRGKEIKQPDFIESLGYDEYWKQ